MMDKISAHNRQIIADHLDSHEDHDGRFAAQTDGGRNLYLPLQYPEGSPAHPAWPAGHAVVAGACVTVLKAMLSVLYAHEETTAGQATTISWREKPWPQENCSAVEATADGSALRDPTTPSDITLVGELNKLASNVALGRNMAGVHYRSDGDEGILLGEQVAIKFLRERLGKAALKKLHSYFRLSTFGGSVITIKESGICLPAGAECAEGDLACPNITPHCS